MWIALSAGVFALSALACAAGWRRARRLLAASLIEQDALTKASQVIDEERRVLELVAKGASLREVLDALTRAIERMTTECFCTVLLLDEDGRHLLEGSGGSLPPEYIHAINGLEIGPEVGACGTAAFRNETTIVGDVATDPRFAGARDFVLSFGLRACWSVPIRDSKMNVIGTFAMYHKYAAIPHDRELRLVEAGAHLAGNIIQRLRAEQKLRENAERIRLAERTASFGIWEIDTTSGSFTMSEGLAAIIGWHGPARLSEDEWRAMIHVEDLPAVSAAVARTSATGEIFQAEYRICLGSGSVRWLRGHARLDAADGHPPRLTGVAIDITKEKEMLVRLEQSRAAAEAALHAKSDFLANMSHEIRTPMNGIIGTISLLLDSGVTEEQRDFVTTIRSGGESLLQLVNDILDLAKIEAGKLVLESIPFRLDGLVKEALAVVSPMARAKGLDVLQTFDAGLPPVLMGDPQRLRQILLNLLSNAIKFTDRGSVGVEVSTGKRSRGAAELIIGVRDTGIGISPDTQKSIFEAFTQADASTTRRYGGTGLGLTICRRIIALMNGSLGLVSQPGRGTCFRLVVALPVAADSAIPQFELEDRILETKRSLKILLVEDNAINQTVGVRLLQRMGHQTAVAVNGAEAVAAAGREYYDLVLMDCQMPVMDGYAATRAIRKLNLPHRLPIIAMTANAMPEDRQRCLQAGMDDYLTKPISAARLSALLETFGSAPLLLAV